ncbi:MAG: hypothetical protein MJ252_29785 [archaeon]|nr:hypothetical protein [archaeon]
MFYLIAKIPKGEPLELKLRDEFMNRFFGYTPEDLSSKETYNKLRKKYLQLFTQFSKVARHSKSKKTVDFKKETIKLIKNFLRRNKTSYLSLENQSFLMDICK